MNVLCVVAHPDDELWMGAAIARHVAQGDQVYVMALADGESCKDSDDLEQRKQARLTAFERSVEALGARCVISGMFPDQLLECQDRSMQNCLRTVIQNAQPVTVYTHSPHDYNRDHFETFWAVVQHTGRRSGVQWVRCVMGDRATDDFKANLVIKPAPEELETKWKARACYAGIVDNLQPPINEQFEVLGMWR